MEETMMFNDWISKPKNLWISLSVLVLLAVGVYFYYQNSVGADTLTEIPATTLSASCTKPANWNPGPYMIFVANCQNPNLHNGKWCVINNDHCPYSSGTWKCNCDTSTTCGTAERKAQCDTACLAKGKVCDPEFCSCKATDPPTTPVIPPTTPATPPATPVIPPTIPGDPYADYQKFIQTCQDPTKHGNKLCHINGDHNPNISSTWKCICEDTSLACGSTDRRAACETFCTSRGKICNTNGTCTCQNKTVGQKIVSVWQSIVSSISGFFKGLFN